MLFEIVFGASLPSHLWPQECAVVLWEDLSFLF